MGTTFNTVLTGLGIFVSRTLEFRNQDSEPVAAPLAQMPVDEIIDRVAVALGHSVTSSYALLSNLDADRIAERRQRRLKFAQRRSRLRINQQRGVAVLDAEPLPQVSRAHPAVSQRLVEAIGGQLDVRHGRNELAFLLSLPLAMA